ncbi:crotonase/enoyl-CoA hydratase family protein [Phenylobacterium montanum]|uniref:Crotonase/enoyl-CoA hydratase family protein n=1 Tax=Phenylobacterium montanum TaxID=2823693 RepID=A0A975FXL2_9CAUL|nr:crotonase/enoyl-CoA hydratase family protein [Caulobacter sp. S6]QUD87021.1 crotonase/enoyl-CoA hydratase family protein [Caulobacter sp. S6]
MDQRVTIEIIDGVADVRLVRADKMNALDNAMFDGLVEAGETLKLNKQVRCVVLSGEGRAFCAGLDASNFGRMAGGGGGGEPENATSRLGPRTHGISNRAQYAVWVWRELEVPVIAAVHGFAYGGGFQLMLGADMRYVTPDARLSILEIKWGLVPDMAGTQLMRHLVREDLVRELTYTGRIFSGAEAQQMGFATRVCDDPRAEALKVAREIAGKSPDAIRAAKRIYNAANYRSAADGLMDESIEQSSLIGSPNQVEAVKANLEQRAPRFAD